MENDHPTWAEKVRYLMDSGLTQQRIADECGLSQATVSELANGQTRSPRGDAALRLHRLFASVTRKKNAALSMRAA